MKVLKSKLGNNIRNDSGYNEDAMQYLPEVHHHQVPVQAHVRLPQGVPLHQREQQQRQQQVEDQEGLDGGEDQPLPVLQEKLCEPRQATAARCQVPRGRAPQEREPPAVAAATTRRRGL